MTELPVLFRDEHRFRQQFVNGLEQMLASHEGLGVFILVLANATYDKAIWRRLGPVLEARFDQTAARMREILRAGRQPDGAEDDVAVFLKLMAVGFDELPLTRFRGVGRFELQFNLLRALRPPRMAGATVNQVFQPFSPEGFHFNRPFLKKEVLWSGELLGRNSRLLYNKFPFAHLHGLLVIEPEANKPQYLAQDDHQMAWELCERAAHHLPGVGFGYNSYGAYASVNHQHFQMFCHPGSGYPVEASCWRHNGGGEVYPVSCMRLDDMSRAWHEIAGLHEQNRAYNLLYRPGCVYLMTRRFQGEYAHSHWTSGFAWSELAGSVTTFNSEDFERITAQELGAEMERLSAHPL